VRGSLPVLCHGGSELRSARSTRRASQSRLDDFEADEAAAAAHQPRLQRLPGAGDLPVIVATRLSLSFPLLISAVPMWIVEHRDGKASFRKHWFTDGGFCSNFPVHLFDQALPTHPTFAINLGTMGRDWESSPIQRDNLKFVKTNREGLSLPSKDLSPKGLAAVTGFAIGAFNTSRNWNDNSYLRYPGHRDRTVLIRQSRAEGGLNLYMSTPVIFELADRGREAASVMVERYTTPQFPKGRARNKALHSLGQSSMDAVSGACWALPGFLRGFALGREALQLNPAEQSAYALSQADQRFAEELFGKLDEAAAVSETSQAAGDRLAHDPRPQAILRRVPQI
jgi:hypothetical protein